MQVWSSERIRILHNTTGLSVQQFAETIGVSDKTVYRWKAAERDDIRIESGPRRILAVLEAQVQQAHEQGRLGELVQKLGLAAATGGGLLVLYRVLQGVFSELG